MSTTSEQKQPLQDSKIEKAVYKVYCEEGQAQAFKEANKYGDKIVYEKCPHYACDTETPTIKGKHECLICGQETKPIPDSKEGLHTKEDNSKWIAEQMLSGKSMAELIVSYSNERKALLDALEDAEKSLESLFESNSFDSFDKATLNKVTTILNKAKSR